MLGLEKENMGGSDWQRSHHKRMIHTLEWNMKKEDGIYTNLRQQKTKKYSLLYALRCIEMK